MCRTWGILCGLTHSSSLIKTDDTLSMLVKLLSSFCTAVSFFVS